MIEFAGSAAILLVAGAFSYLLVKVGWSMGDLVQKIKDDTDA